MKGSFYLMISLIVVASIVYFVTRGDSDNKLSPYFLTQELLEINKSKYNGSNYSSIDDYHRLQDQLEELKYERLYEERLVMLEEERKRKAAEEKKRKQELAAKKKEEERLAQLAKAKEEENWHTYEITAFTNYEESTGKTESHPLFGVTASGNQTQEGLTIACPKEIPFGTKIYIEILNHTYICHDRGSKITSNKLDVYMQDIDRAVKFGRQKSRIKIIE